jgi:hypothetical protein
MSDERELKPHKELDCCGTTFMCTLWKGFESSRVFEVT